MWVVLTCEEMGKGAGGELRWGSEGPGYKALVAGEACGSGTIRVIAAVQDL